MMKYLHTSLRRLLTGAFFAGGIAVASGNILPFAFSYEEPHFIGTKKAEAYDIAIKISGDEFKDYVVSGFSVPLADGEGFEDISVWMSSSLELVDKVNVPDIVSVEGAVVDGVLAVDFPESYKVPAEGVYVGYTFTITEVLDDTQKFPVAATYGANPNGYFIHSSRTYRKWANSSERDGCCSAIKVYFEGDFPENMARIDAVADIRCAFEESIAMPTTVANLGANSVSSLTYDYRVGAESGRNTFEPVTPIEPGLGYKALIELPLPVQPQVGTYQVEVELVEVNGVAVDEGGTASSVLRIISFVPRHFPLVEEYTGTWCQFCPRGMAAMERMTSLYPDEFICMVFHNDDVMQTYKIYPNTPSGLPAAFVDRTILCDPYFGTGEEHFGIEQVWLQQRNTFTPGAITVSAAWSDASMENVDVEAKVVFAEDPESACAVSYVLCENGLCGTSSRWAQKNAFAGMKNTFIPEMDVFCEGSEYVEGLKFNEVVMRSSEFKGVENSLPEAVTPDVEYTHQYSFSNVSDITNIYSEVLMQNKNNLFVVALLVDSESGAVLNAAKCKITDNSGIADTAVDAEPIRVSYYTLDGRPAGERCATAILLEKAEYSDGSVAWRKVLRRK